LVLFFFLSFVFVCMYFGFCVCSLVEEDKRNKKKRGERQSGRAT
jgi:hypothetical protein